MASSAQLNANRQNSKKAGVKTTEGKLRSRFNAMKHGLTASVLLSNSEEDRESQSLYLEILNGLTESLQPKTFLEESLIDQMARTQFKMQRSERLEKGAFLEKDILCTGAGTLAANETKMGLALRYQKNLQSQYSQALKQFLDVKQLRELDSFSEPVFENTQGFSSSPNQNQEAPEEISDTTSPPSKESQP